MAKGALLAVLAYKLIRLILVPDTNITGTIMSAIRAIHKDGNPDGVVINISKITV